MSLREPRHRPQTPATPPNVIWGFSNCRAGACSRRFLCRCATFGAPRPSAPLGTPRPPLPPPNPLFPPQHLSGLLTTDRRGRRPLRHRAPSGYQPVGGEQGVWGVTSIAPPGADEAMRGRRSGRKNQVQPRQRHADFFGSPQAGVRGGRPPKNVGVSRLLYAPRNFRRRAGACSHRFFVSLRDVRCASYLGASGGSPPPFIHPQTPAIPPM